MAVAFDAVGPSSSGITVANQDFLDWNHTCSGSNRLLVVGVAFGEGNDAGVTTAVTYNLVPMTSAGKRHSGDLTAGYVELFYLKNPDLGTNQVAVTVSGGGGSGDLECGSMSFTGVDQTTPVRNANVDAGSGTIPTITIASAVGNMVVDAVAGGATIPATNQTLGWNAPQNGNTGGGNGASSRAAGAASVVMSYGSSYTDVWAIAAMDIIAAVEVTDSVSLAGKYNVRIV